MRLLQEAGFQARPAPWLQACVASPVGQAPAWLPVWAAASPPLMAAALYGRASYAHDGGNNMPAC